MPLPADGNIRYRGVAESQPVPLIAWRQAKDDMRRQDIAIMAVDGGVPGVVDQLLGVQGYQLSGCPLPNWTRPVLHRPSQAKGSDKPQWRVWQRGFVLAESAVSADCRGSASR